MSIQAMTRWAEAATSAPPPTALDWKISTLWSLASTAGVVNVTSAASATPLVAVLLASAALVAWRVPPEPVTSDTNLSVASKV